MFYTCNARGETPMKLTPKWAELN